MDIQKFLKRNALDIYMFGHVNALRMNLPTISLDNAILNFYKYCKIDQDDFPIEAVRATYYRMNAEFNDMQKTKTP